MASNDIIICGRPSEDAKRAAGKHLHRSGYVPPYPFGISFSEWDAELTERALRKPGDASSESTLPCAAVLCGYHSAVPLPEPVRMQCVFLDADLGVQAVFPECVPEESEIPECHGIYAARPVFAEDTDGGFAAGKARYAVCSTLFTVPKSNPLFPRSVFSVRIMPCTFAPPEGDRRVYTVPFGRNAVPMSDAWFSAAVADADRFSVCARGVRTADISETRYGTEKSYPFSGAYSQSLTQMPAGTDFARFLSACCRTVPLSAGAEDSFSTVFWEVYRDRRAVPVTLRAVL